MLRLGLVYVARQDANVQSSAYGVLYPATTAVRKPPTLAGMLCSHGNSNLWRLAMSAMQGILLVCLLVVLQRLVALAPSFGRWWDVLIWLALAILLVLCLLGKLHN